MSLLLLASLSFIQTGWAQSKPGPVKRGPVRPDVTISAEMAQRIPGEWYCNDLPFRFNTDNLSEGHTNCLDQAADPGGSIIIDGHRDSSERVGISIVRANLFRDYLINRRGIDASRIKVRNLSDTCPLSFKETWRNSRVDVGFMRPGEEFDFNHAFRKCEVGSKPYVVTHESPSAFVRSRPSQLALLKRGR
jgi:hypothetical protein